MNISRDQFTEIFRRRSYDELQKIVDMLAVYGVVTVGRDLERELEEAKAEAFAAGWMARARI